MLLLGIDCSHSSGSVCIQNSNSILFHKEWRQQKSHAEFITQVLADAFHLLQITAKDFTAIVVNEGPGSFTGLRIAINTAKAFAFTHNTSIYPLNSLEVTAHGVLPSNQKLLVALNAHSGMCYVQEFKWDKYWETLSTPRVLAASALTSEYDFKNYILAGEGFEVYKDILFKEATHESSLYQMLPNAILLNNLLIQTQHSRKKITWKDLQPFYVRLSAPEEKNNLKKNS